jgi:deoxyribose-phosphate aldolase
MGRVKICTVIGFPLGYSCVEAKIAETKKAICDGADEIDMVINIGALKEKRYDDILSEISQIKAVCGDKILKVIIETCLLETEEKIIMCDIVSRSGADYIKTSTGFSTGGATKEDIILMRDNVKGIGIKAAGGIKSLRDAEEFLSLGATRLGTSRIVKILKKDEENEQDTAY